MNMNIEKQFRVVFLQCGGTAILTDNGGYIGDEEVIAVFSRYQDMDGYWSVVKKMLDEPRELAPVGS